MSDIRFEVSGRAGIVTLDRPKALNALTEAMCHALDEALAEWARDDRIERVAIRSDGRHFCAGGDLRAIHSRRAGGIDFFAAEYRTDYRIATFPKPYVSLLDGIAMGGGIGVSLHGSHVVAGEALSFAMPEVAIGLFPDVGTAGILADLPDEAGTWLALTGDRIGRDAAAALGLVTHPTETGRLGDALDRVAHARRLDDALADLVVRVEPRDPDEAAMVAAAFAHDDVADILEALDDAEHDAAARMAATIATRSPTSLCLTLAHLRRAKPLDVAEVFRDDFRICSRILDGHDLYEGIRAILIDKDGAPRWDPAELAKVDRREIEAHFEEPPGGDLDLVRAR